jgi:helicase
MTKARSTRKKTAGRFRGLFVGIDKYASLGITELRCAERDARALHALFTDTLGEGGELLCGSSATRAELEARLGALASSSPDDVVVLGFSGHGSETHELVTYDTDPAELAKTALPLDRLLELFKAIPARRLVCVLDCCFSGELGAKVLTTDLRPRSMKSTEAILAEMAGEGRLILTASKADEPAWENQRVGHGLLTHYLLRALQGAEEVRTRGKVSVLRLVEYTVQRVIADSDQIGYRQHPTIRGTLDGELTWPVFKPGAHYSAAFPDRVSGPVTEEVASLAHHGFRSEILEAWAGTIEKLNPLQLAAVQDFGVLEGEHLLVSAPTSSGKTMVGELAALNAVEAGRRAVFLLPMKALVNDKHQEFERKYGAAGVRTIRATGEHADQVPALLHGQYEIALLTYEKFAGLVLAHPHLLDQIGAVVIDEVQMLADENRGAGLEFLLTLLRVRRQYGAHPQVVALSAVIGETNGLERWLGGRLLRRDERPVPLDEGVVEPDGSFHYQAAEDEERSEPCIQPEFRGRSPRQNFIVPLVRRLVSEEKQVIVFREKRGETVGTAGYLASDLRREAADEALEALPAGDPSASSQALREALACGVAFHNSDLSREERATVEGELRKADSKVRVVVATTTLAMGINTGADAVVIAGLQHPGRPPKPYTVAEYKNMVGRAGRLGFSERGTSYLIATDHGTAERYWLGYVQGEPEDLASRFLDPNADPRGQILRVLAAGSGIGGEWKVGMTRDEVVDFLEQSFGAFQQRDQLDQWGWDTASLHQAVEELAGHDLIEEGSEGRYLLTDLGLLAAESGHEVVSTLRLVQVLQSLPPGSINERALIAAIQVTAELERIWLPMHAKSPKEPQRWFSFLELSGVAPPLLLTLRRVGADRRTATMRAKRAASCLMWMSSRPLQQIEADLTRHVLDNTAAGQLIQTTSRTADLVPLACGVAEILHPELDLTEVRESLLLRLELGLPEEAVQIAEAMGDRLTRADYLVLVAAGHTSPEAISAAEDEALAGALGNDLGKQLALREAMGEYGARAPGAASPDRAS